MNYQTHRVHLAFFLTGVDMSSKFEIARAVRRSAGALLEVDPLLLPLPPDSPPDFPLIVLRNEASGWTFQMAPARFDLAVQYGPAGAPPSASEPVDHASRIALGIWANLATNFAARSNRLGMIITTVTQVEDAPEALRTRFLNPNYGRGARESQLHLLDELKADGFEVNRWARVRALPPNEVWPMRLTLEVDINTRAEVPFEVDKETADRFLSMAKRVSLMTIDEYLSE